jgi:hypothetical protein
VIYQVFGWFYSVECTVISRFCLLLNQEDEFITVKVESNFYRRLQLISIERVSLPARRLRLYANNSKGEDWSLHASGEVAEYL